MDRRTYTTPEKSEKASSSKAETRQQSEKKEEKYEAVFITDEQMQAQQKVADKDKLAGFPPLTKELWEIADQVVISLSEHEQTLAESEVRVLGLVEFQDNVRADHRDHKPFGISFSGGDKSFGALIKMTKLLPTHLGDQLHDLPSGGEVRDCAAAKWGEANAYKGTCEIWLGKTRNPYPVDESCTGFGSLMYSCATCQENYTARNKETANQEPETRSRRAQMNSGAKGQANLFKNLTGMQSKSQTKKTGQEKTDD